MNIHAKAAVMKLFVRWCKFNLVGVMGMVVQLAALAVIDRFARGHYLYATAAAVEITLVHNFIWHLHFTWRDRRDGSPLMQFLRFHVSNGMVSLLGNLALMPMLVSGLRIPLLISNSIAILCCSIINFCLGHKWAFGVRATVMES